ncbi:MAG: HNH/endonuclease VII fold toxin-2 domain-containing protein, partial [Pseudomonas sp.]
HNHASQPGNTAPWTYADRMAMADGIAECDKAKENVKTKCGDIKKKAKCPSSAAITRAEKARKAAKDTHGLNSRQYNTQNAKVTAEYKAYAKAVQSDPCQRALRCFLSPYKPSRCCPKQTPHHVVDAASFTDGPAFPGQPRSKHPKKTGWKKYSVNKAPCVCAEGPNQTTASHGLMHVRTGVVAQAKQKNGEWTRKQATDTGVKAMTKTFPGTKACEACLKKQLDKYHDSARTTPDDKPINANVEMTADPTARTAAAKVMLPPPRRRR